jgi:sugar porter (SP) family MFS transporter
MKKSEQFVYTAAGLCALGGMLFGYDTGVISSAILFIKDQFALTSLNEEIVVSAVLAGALLGAGFAGRLVDLFGRREIIIATAVIFGAAGLATAFAPTVAWLIIGRLIIGIAIGAASFAVPLYISEVSPAEVRGKLVSFNQLAITVGIVVSYLVGYIFAPMAGWRWMFGLAVVPAVILGIGMYFMPPSPRWLLSRGRESQARQVLERIRATRQVDQEFQEIRESLKVQSEDWRELFNPSIRRALIVGAGLAIFQQITGINTVIYYAPTIFGLAGFKSASVAILATVGVGIVNVLMTVLALALLDKVGRRPLTLISLAGMVVSLMVLGFFFKFPGMPGIVAVAALMFYVGSFAIGMGPVFWLLIAEIYPLKIRGVAMSAVTLINWAANFVVALTFLTLVNFAGAGPTFWLYGLVGVAALIFAWGFVPETNQRTLEEIEVSWISTRTTISIRKSSK